MFVARVVNDSVTEVADYRSLFPNTSFTPSGPDDEFLAQNGCMRLVNDKVYDFSTQKLVGTTPYVDGGVVYTVVVEPKSQADIDAETAAKATEVRAQRNRMLAETDWRFRSDMSPSQAWGNYCQALRDVTTQPGFPFTVTWPVAPT